MINLSLDELRLIAQIRNISVYENKPEKDLIRALSKPKPKRKKQISIEKLFMLLKTINIFSNQK